MATASYDRASESVVGKITFSEAAKLLPVGDNGKRLSPDTIARWAWKGRRGVRLRTWKFGRTRYTSEQALIEFGVELAEAADRHHASEQQARRGTGGVDLRESQRALEVAKRMGVRVD